MYCTLFATFSNLQISRISMGCFATLKGPSNSKKLSEKRSEDLVKLHGDSDATPAFPASMFEAQGSVRTFFYY